MTTNCGRCRSTVNCCLYDKASPNEEVSEQSQISRRNRQSAVSAFLSAPLINIQRIGENFTLAGMSGKLQNWLNTALYVTALLFFVAVLAFCIFYIRTDYTALREWYLSLNGCIYRRVTWARDFFSPAVKSDGNQLAIIAMMLAVPAAAYITYEWIKFRKEQPQTRHTAATAEWQWYAAVAALAVLLGASSWGLAKPSNDEVFSAVNCAELPAFQVITYYMLPNNHMYYNLVNHFATGWVGDAITTGRLISFMAYTGTLLTVYHCLRRFVEKPAVAFIILLPVALQFQAWGFATQARGYESMLLCSWVSIDRLVKYITTNSASALRVNAIANAIALALIPTSVYLVAAQVIFVGAMMIYERSIRWGYLKAVLLTCITTFMLYLPAFCFSGIRAFTENPYVVPRFSDWLSFLPEFTDFTKTMVNGFLWLPGENNPVNYVLFCVPLFLFFSKSTTHRSIAGFYVVLWVVYGIVTLHMRLHPFLRNMIALYSIAMACAVYALYAFINFISARIPASRTRYGFVLLAVMIPLTCCCGYQLMADRHYVCSNLYFSQVNDNYRLHKPEIEQIPAGSSVGFSDEGFYFYYYCRKWGYKVNKCGAGTEEYYAKRTGEELPADVAGNYTLFEVCTEGYDVWKRK